MIASRLSTDLYGKYIGRFLPLLLVPEYRTSSSYLVLKNSPSRLSPFFVCPYSLLRLFVPFLIHTSFASIQACFAIERSIGRRFRLVSTIGAAVSQWIAEFQTRWISTILRSITCLQRRWTTTLQSGTASDAGGGTASKQPISDESRAHQAIRLRWQDSGVASQLYY